MGCAFVTMAAHIFRKTASTYLFFENTGKIMKFCQFSDKSSPKYGSSTSEKANKKSGKHKKCTHT